MLAPIVASIIALIVAFAGSFHQALAQDQPDSRSNVIHGIVVNAATQDPIGRALVYSPDNRYATLTDGEGHFEFILAKPAAESAGTTAGDTVWLMARKPGFLDDSSNGRRQIPTSPGTDLTISLEPEALIKGRVATPAGDAARGIVVEILFRRVQDGIPRWMPKTQTIANSNGEFRFAELEPGLYKVLTHEWMDNDPEATVPGGQLYGFPPVYYPSSADLASAATIQLAAGQTVQADFSLIRQHYYPVKIPVVNPEANGGINITVSPHGQHGPGYSLGYNSGKQAIEGQLPNGKYLVEAAVFVPDSSAAGSVNITVAGAPSQGPSMVLARNNSITVNVREEFTSTDSRSSGAIPIRGRTLAMPKIRFDLNIWAESADDFAPQRQGSLRAPAGPNDDSLVIENLAPGRYWLRLSAQRGYIASATTGGVDLLRSPLVVVPGASTQIDITMRDDSAELQGTLNPASSTQSGSPTPGAPASRGGPTPPGYVYCIPLPDSAGQFLELTASYDGKFDNPMIAPGNYRVVAFRNRERDIPYRDAEAMKVYESKGQVVHFAPGQKVTLQLEVQPNVE
jgi:hypothetical protein